MDEYTLDQLQNADIEIDKGNFVTMSRLFSNGIVEEHLMTFSGVTVKRVQLYADYAEALGESEADS